MESSQTKVARLTEKLFDQMFWREQLDMASKLTDAELERHALVSTRNRHVCRQCFCCACVAVSRKRKLDKSAHIN